MGVLVAAVCVAAVRLVLARMRFFVGRVFFHNVYSYAFRYEKDFPALWRQRRLPDTFYWNRTHPEGLKAEQFGSRQYEP